MSGIKAYCQRIQKLPGVRLEGGPSVQAQLRNGQSKLFLEQGYLCFLSFHAFHYLGYTTSGVEIEVR